MRRYRIYLIDTDNHIASALDYEGPDDLAALDNANRLRQSRAAEIWQSTRLVARITPQGEAAQPSS